MGKEIDLTKINKDELVNVINLLVYENYKWNRQQFPLWTVEQWANGVFGIDAYLYEIRYQKELNG